MITEVTDVTYKSNAFLCQRYWSDFLSPLTIARRIQKAELARH